MRAINISLLLFLLFYTVFANAESDTEELKKHINNLVTKGYEIVNDPNLTDEEQISESKKLIRDNLHLSWMAKYSLGRNRRVLSVEKIEEFTEVYSKLIVQAYAELSKNYSNVKAVIKKVKRIDNNMFIVSMDFSKKGSNNPVTIDYMVHKIQEGETKSYKIGDIITEGISILNSQQSEFNSVISNNGIDTLINNLKEKISTKNK